MEKIVRCPKCKGRGRVHNWFEGACTLGLSLLAEAACEGYMDECPRCDGEGYIKIRL